MRNYTKEQLAQCGVYTIRNTINGKTYIGSTSISFAYRWKQHRNALKSGTNGCVRLQRAVTKYGLDAFDFEITLVCDPTDSIAFEQCYLDIYQTYGEHGYNSGRFALAPWKGRKHSPESIAWMSIVQTGRVTSEETKALQRLAKLGGKLTDEHRKNVAIAMKNLFANGLQPVKGSTNGKAVLNEQKVKKIWKALGKGITCSQLARDYNVGFNTIRGIKIGRTWSQITGKSLPSTTTEIQNDIAYA